MPRAFRFAATMAFVLLFACPEVWGLKISQIEFDLQLSAGSDASYSFLVINNEAETREITVYVGDWIRMPTGENDFLPLNGARWLFPREFLPGDTLDVVYRVELSGQDATVLGTYVCASPYVQGSVEGEYRLSSMSSEPSRSQTGAVIDVVREILSVSPDGQSLTVRLAIRINEAFAGLRLDEVFSSHVHVEPIDLADGEFATVERSNGDWLEVTPVRFSLAEGESRDVAFSMRVPGEAMGAYWSAVFVEGSPRIEEREGTTVLSVERFAIKVYETVPGTELRSGTVTGVDILTTAPLTLEVAFENTGNVQLRPSGSIDIISSTGEVVQELAIGGFPVLPGAVRLLTVTEAEEAPLPPGIYRALVTIDYGGETLTGGTRDFRIR